LVGALALLVVPVVSAEASLTAGLVDGGRSLNRPLDAMRPKDALDSVSTLSFQALGGPMIGNSWDALFYVHAPTAFSHLGVVVGAGGALEGSPSMLSFANLAGPLASWSQFFGPGPGATGSTALSFGTPTNDLFWGTHFAGNDPASQSFDMTLFSFNDIGSNVWDGTVASWNGAAWSITGVPDLHAWRAFQETVAGGTIETVPVPTAALLGLVGLSCAATLRKWFV
jgi:hypothetical protein